MNSIPKLFNIELMSILGKGRAKKGMFEGDLEIVQLASYVHSIKPAAQILNEIGGGSLYLRKNVSAN